MLVLLLPPAVGLDQHILRISKLLVPLNGEASCLLWSDTWLNLLNSAGMKTGAYRVVTRLTEGDGPRVSEGDEYAFSTRDVMAAFNHDIEPLFPNDPQTYWHRWQEPKPCPETLREVVELPYNSKKSEAVAFEVFDVGNGREAILSSSGRACHIVRHEDGTWTVDEDEHHRIFPNRGDALHCARELVGDPDLPPLSQI